jgi:hypothetical protein
MYWLIGPRARELGLHGKSAREFTFDEEGLWAQVVQLRLLSNARELSYFSAVQVDEN